MSLNILNNCSISESPLNNGSPRHNSAMIHPIAHTSTSNEYLSSRSKISGGRYHSRRLSLPDLSLSFGSSGVYAIVGTVAIRLSAKSASLS